MLQFDISDVTKEGVGVSCQLMVGQSSVPHYQQLEEFTARLAPGEVRGRLSMRLPPPWSSDVCRLRSISRLCAGLFRRTRLFSCSTWRCSVSTYLNISEFSSCPFLAQTPFAGLLHHHWFRAWGDGATWRPCSSHGPGWILRRSAGLLRETVRSTSASADAPPFGHRYSSH